MDGIKKVFMMVAGGILLLPIVLLVMAFAVSQSLYYTAIDKISSRPHH